MANVRSTRSTVSELSWSRVSGIRRSTGLPFFSSMKGSSTITFGISVRSIFAPSAAFLIRCIATVFCERSVFVS